MLKYIPVVKGGNKNRGVSGEVPGPSGRDGAPNGSPARAWEAGCVNKGGRGASGEAPGPIGGDGDGDFHEFIFASGDY